MRTIPITTGELAKRLGCHLVGSDDIMLRNVNTIVDAITDELTFLANPRYRKYLSSSNAGAIILPKDIEVPNSTVQLISNNPYADFKRAIEILYDDEEPEVAAGVHPLAVIHKTAKLGAETRVGPNVHIETGAQLGTRCIIYSSAYVGRDVVIGDDCIIGVNASIRREVRIGSRVLIGDGTVVGYDGFGYVPGPKSWDRIRPVGTVEIADDVHIGANCCIDRATVGVTKIGKGSKLDNLIQIAHGVEIGENTAIAAQTGISGSARIGSWVMMGGQVGLVGHIDIGDQMKIGAQAGVTNSFDIKGLITGYPARPYMEQRRIDASLSKLPELLKRMKALEEKMKDEG